jgi:hypothetical protein
MLEKKIVDTHLVIGDASKCSYTNSPVTEHTGASGHEIK